MSPVPNPFAYVGPPSGEVRSCWRGREAIPGARDLPRYPGVRWTTIQPARPTVAGGLAFQHGVHLVWHGETLLASWAVNLATENTGGSLCRCGRARTSAVRGAITPG